MVKVRFVSLPYVVIIQKLTSSEDDCSGYLAMQKYSAKKFLKFAQESF
jgi:hypothetical protein